jgi:DNA polymerase-3 subunit beta
MHMTFTCEKALLADAVHDAARAVSAHATMEVLKGLLFEADADGVTVTGNNLSVGIRSRLEAEVQKPGRAVIDARMIGDIVRKMPDAAVTVSIADNYVVSVTCSDSSFNITALPADNYPALPDVDVNRDLSLPQSLLRTMLSRTLYAVSQNENKVIITGALFDIEGDRLTIVALDGYRLALCQETVETGNTETFSFVTPGAALREVERMLDDSDEPVTLRLGTRHILFSVGGRTLLSRLLEGEFLNYRNAIPPKRSHLYAMDTKTFLNSVERVSLLIDEKLKNPVRIRFGGERAALHCMTPLGRADDQFPCDGGDELEIGFNHRYLIDALKAVPDKEIRFETDGALSPSLILPPEGDNYLFMVLPVRLKDV